MADAQNNPPLRGAVEFCEHEAADVHALLEKGGLSQSVLADRRVEYQKGVMDIDRISTSREGLVRGSSNFLEFRHQLLAGVEAARGVAQDHVVSVISSALDTIEDHCRGIRARFAAMNVDAAAFGPDLELLARRGPKSITGDEQDLAALRGVAGRKFPECGCFAHPIDADHQRDVREGFYVVEQRRGFDFEDLECVGADRGPYDVGVRDLLPVQHLGHPREQVLGRSRSDVGSKKNFFDVVLELLVDLGMAPKDVGEAGDKSAPRSAESPADSLALGLWRSRSRLRGGARWSAPVRALRGLFRDSGR